MAGTRIGQAERITPAWVAWPQSVWRLFRQWPIISVTVLAGLAVLGVSAPWLAPYGPVDAELIERLSPPAWFSGGSTRHLLGTDHIGRDILSRMMYGGRVSLMVAAVSIISGFVLGTSIGVVSGYFGGFVDEVVTRIVDIWYSLPFLMVALVVVLVMGQTMTVLLALLALLAWAPFVRVVRGQVLSLKEMDYVALARVAGASHRRIMVWHIFPGVVNSAVVIGTLNVGMLILAEATLSFLGAGIPPPTPSWGIMVSEGRDFISTAWWIAFFPGMAIFLTVMSLNFLGDWLRDRLDPRLRQLHTA